MNQLITTHNGGFPLVLDDVRFLMESYTTAFKGILNGFSLPTAETIILSGCEKTTTGGVTTVSTGFVALAGEVCFVPEHSYINPSAGEKEYWDLELSFVPAGDKEFQNSVVHSTYQQRIAKVFKAFSVPVGRSRYNYDLNLYYVIEERLPRRLPEVIDSKNFSGVDYDITAHIDLNGYMHVDASNGYPVDFVVGTVVTDQFVGIYTPLKANIYSISVKSPFVTNTMTHLCLRLLVSGELTIVSVDGPDVFGWLPLENLLPIYVGV